MIDLHIHSTFSDGSDTPGQLAAMAHAKGLTALALTDHDTMAGVPDFIEACRTECVQGIAGVEISAEYPFGTMHMLGYLIDPAHAELSQALGALRGGREDRNRLILKKLNDLKLVLTWEEVAAFADEDVVGRPHFAQALLARGYVRTKEEAFDRYLGKGKPAYVDRLRLTPEESIRVIRAAGGVAVLAHPFTIQRSAGELRKLVATLVESGLGGIEGYYSEYTYEQQSEYQQFARDFNLIMTGGSDYHGAFNPDIALGRGFGNLKVPDELLTPLYARAGRSLP